MSALAKIKKQAAQHEHERQYDKALVLYTRLLDESPDPDEDIDVALYNRAGDVALRAGDLPRAVTYYERALDLYAAGGFLNNAIALGAKILRQAPDRVATHYTLGVLHAKKGFRSDARQHFLTYAERMQRAGQGSEVARSLADYLALCDGAADARTGLAAHLASGTPRPADAAATLQELLEQALRAAGQWDGGPDAQADAAREAPASRPDARSAAVPAADLVFLDLDASGFADDSHAVAPTAVHEPLDLLPVADAEPSRPWESAPLALDLDEGTAPLRELPGELPPLAPSMVALAMAGDVAEAPSASTEPAPLGVPAFADDGDWEAPVRDLPLLDVDEPLAPPHLAPTRPAAIAPFDLTFEVPEVPEVPEAPAAAAADVTFVDVPAAEPAVDLPPPASAAPTPDDDGLDLGAWLRASEPARSTRLVAPVIPTTGDEQADFRATLDAFKAGVARSLEDADFDAHYDLGVAYKEMGLLEEAIGEFQKASRAPGRPLRALEALASCFLERGEPELVLSTLAPVTGAPGGVTPGAAEAPQHVALCYLLGAASQEVGRIEDARAWYLRVLATDYAFRDAAARLASLSPPPR